METSDQTSTLAASVEEKKNGRKNQRSSRQGIKRHDRRKMDMMSFFMETLGISSHTLEKFLEKKKRRREEENAVDSVVHSLRMIIVVTVFVSFALVFLSYSEFSPSLRKSSKESSTMRANNTLPYEQTKMKNNEEEDDIPPSIWPVTIQDEIEDNFEDFVHPGDSSVTIPLPKFWKKNNGGLNGGKLLTKKQALKIGSLNHAGDIRDGFGVEDERTILVTIASYRDWQCR